MAIKVRATRVGFYDETRHYPVDNAHPRAGLPFFLEDREGLDANGKKVLIKAEQQFSPNWMERVEDDTPARQIPRKAKVPHGIPEKKTGKAAVEAQSGLITRPEVI